MARQRLGSIYKEKCGNWCARVTFTCSSGKRKNIKRKAKTKTDASQILKLLLRQLEDEGKNAINAATMSFNSLAEYYLKTYLIAANIEMLKRQYFIFKAEIAKKLIEN